MTLEVQSRCEGAIQSSFFRLNDVPTLVASWPTPE